MIDINKLKLTDMGNPELIPQLVEEMNTKFIKEEEKIICEKLFGYRQRYTNKSNTGNK